MLIIKNTINNHRLKPTIVDSYFLISLIIFLAKFKPLILGSFFVGEYQSKIPVQATLGRTASQFGSSRIELVSLGLK